MRKRLLARLRDRVAVDLVALAVVVVAGSEKKAALVAAGAVGSPDIVDVEELLVGTGLRGAVDGDGAAVGGLSGAGDRDVAVFLVAECDHVARRGAEGGTAGGLVALGLLGATHGVGGEDDVRVASIGREEVDELRVVEIGGGTEHVASWVADIGGEGSVGVDDAELLDPAVSEDGGEKGDDEEFAWETHGGGEMLFLFSNRPAICRILISRDGKKVVMFVDVGIVVLLILKMIVGGGRNLRKWKKRLKGGTI